MRFSFIHAADLHIDSPLAALGVKDAEIAARFAEAGRRAVRSLVRETIESQAAFLIIAGDIFDREWKDVTTGLFFVNELAQLDRAGISTFIIKGNHDADGVVSSSLPYPKNVRIFDSRSAETVLLEQHQVALHGRSFPARHVAPDFAANYPARKEGWLNIGLLHTGLDGTRGHESYAPCTVADLARYSYDYWALGHIHAGEIVSQDPWIVYPGILQGRNVRETGPKGAVRVTVDDGRIRYVETIELDHARWEHAQVDVGACDDMDSVNQQISAAIEAVHLTCGGKPLALRLTLLGETALHEQLVAGRERLLDEARALALHFADDCWIEKVRVATVGKPINVAQDTGPDAIDVAGLLQQASADPAFAHDVRALIQTIRDKLPAAIRDDVLEDMQALEQQIVSDAAAFLRGSMRP